MNEVISYAPGDGAIAFTCTERRFNRHEGDFEHFATERNPSREEIEVIQQSKFPDYLLIQLGEATTRQQTIEVEAPVKRKPGRPRKHPKMELQTITIEVPPQFRLCAPVFRVGPTTLRIGDAIYRYEVDEENIFWIRDKEYTDFNLSIQCLRYIGDEVGEEPQEVKNVNTRGSICWFLNHEKIIVKQYPDQDETAAANVDQLKEAVQNLQRAGMSPEEIQKLMES